MVRGWVTAESGDPRAGLAEMGEARAVYADIGSRLRRPPFLGLTARAHRLAGRTEEAVRLVEEALETCEETGERWYQAELLGLKADLLRDRGEEGQSESEALLRRAVEVARAQGASALAERLPTGPSAG